MRSRTEDRSLASEVPGSRAVNRDDEYPDSNKSSSRSAREISPQGSRDIHDDEDFSPAPADGAEGDGLSRRLVELINTFHPFMSFFYWMGVRRYPRISSDHAKVERHIADQRGLHRLFIVLDTIFLGLLVVLLLFVLSVVVVRTLNIPVVWLNS